MTWADAPSRRPTSVGHHWARPWPPPGTTGLRPGLRPGPTPQPTAADGQGSRWQRATPGIGKPVAPWETAVSGNQSQVPSSAWVQIHQVFAWFVV